VTFTERDLLRRLIQDFARMFAALVGLRERVEFQTAEQELAAYVKALLGQLARDADRLDSATLGNLLKPERLEHYAMLIAERSKLRAAEGREREAAADRVRALELLLEARAKTSVASTEQRISELLVEVDVGKLEKRYRELLDRSA
jgi:hypothetical protein